MPDLFISYAFNEKTLLYYVAVVFTLVISITLHELGHGWMALRLGDTTPRDLGRMNLNPFIAMGGFSLAMCFIIGLAWGAMPINPYRIRGRYGEAWVAAAGPAVNVILAILGLIGLAIALVVAHANGNYIYWDDGTLIYTAEQPLVTNTVFVLRIFAETNIVLVIFNLMPVPPLDGSHILANFHRGYARLLNDPEKGGVFLIGFIAIFMLASYFWQAANWMMTQYVDFVAANVLIHVV